MERGDNAVKPHGESTVTKNKTTDSIKLDNKSMRRKMQPFIDQINNYADMAVLRSYIGSYSKDILESYLDEQNLDVLHHAIIANNVEAVNLLFFKGMFRPPHEAPKGLPYMHLAAKLGHNTILSLLLQERPRDNKAEMFNYKSEKLKEITESSNSVPVKPIDIAAENGHLKCVKTILDRCQRNQTVKTGKVSITEGYIYSACHLDSPTSLRLLLSQSDATPADVQSAVTAALEMARTECLDVLLGMRPDLSQVFQGMNLYHVLYSYSRFDGVNRFESLLSVTTVLIKHELCFSTCVPFRTYPLYSLLATRQWHNFEKAAPYMIACLLLLLKSGADPNFDEVEFEVTYEDKFRTAIGRPAYSSALHCMFHVVSEYSERLEDMFYVKKYLTKCTELLLKYNSDPNAFGRIREDSIETEELGNSLHSFSRTSVKTGVDRQVLLLLLAYGADPLAKCDDLFPIELFFKLLIKEECIAEETIKNEIENISLLFDSMPLHALREARDKLVERIRENYSTIDADEKSRASLVQAAYDKHLSSTRSLKQNCIIEIWTCCRRRVTNVLQLPLPKSLLSDITGMSGSD